jgi:hypothetical protein
MICAVSMDWICWIEFVLRIPSDRNEDIVFWILYIKMNKTRVLLEKQRNKQWVFAKEIAS